MKKILCIAAVAMLTLSAMAAPKKTVKETVTPASDSLITYLGRTLVDGGSVSFDWTATYVRISFEGNYLAINASDTRRNYFNVWIDKAPTAEPDRIIAIGNGDENSTFGKIEANSVYDGRIEIVNEADFKAIYGKKIPSQHFVTIQKRTEGEQGTTTFKEIITKGKLIHAMPLKTRRIEFVGDSYTCGYGTENSVSTDPFTPETENSGKSYASIVSRYFNADYTVVAHSGMGVVRNYNSNVAGWYMPERYTQTFDMNRDVKWDAPQSEFKPDVTVIYLGTNDFSVSMQPKESAFIAGYLKLLQEIKDNYGEDHPILCMSSICDENLSEYIHEAVKKSEMKNVNYMDFTPGIHHTDDRNLGASFHPNYLGHQKLAYQVIPYIATLTSWGLNNEVIK
jgi:lysophospholipase L1-like esterase